MSIKDALKNEKEFFATHPVYNSYTDRLGIDYLSQSLNRILC